MTRRFFPTAQANPNITIMHAKDTPATKSIVSTGGCLCGAVRYVVQGPPGVVLNCHCADCRKAAGAPFVTWAVFPRDALTWSGAEPKRVCWEERLRLFCPDCGTPIAVLPGELADIIVVSVCTMDHPEALRPECDAWTQDMLPWVRLADHLPRYVAGVAAPATESAPATSLRP